MWCAIILSIGFTARALATPVSTKTIPSDPAVAALSTEALIDQLQDEAPGDPQRRWPAMVIAFQSLDAPQRFEQNLPRDPRSPVMVELIRRGVEAVPLLLAHLTDARPTRLVDYHQPEMINDGGTWFADGFDPRKAGTVFSPPVNHEVDFKTTRELKAGESYTVKIGDLCFFALGQIVDRRLLVFGSVVKDHILWIRSRSINSPVEFPALAAAARKDWGGLTREEHERLLETDAWENDALGRNPAVVMTPCSDSCSTTPTKGAASSPISCGVPSSLITARWWTSAWSLGGRQASNRSPPSRLFGRDMTRERSTHYIILSPASYSWRRVTGAAKKRDGT
jgi:hypothetical protein